MKEPQYIKTTLLGNKFYYKDESLAVFHRTDGPAAEYPNGLKYWYINGELHRTDGPAIEHADGGKEWYINGKKLTEEEFNKTMNKEPQYIKIDSYGNKFYYKDKEFTNLHRTDGPAIEYANYSKEWWVNGERHREDGPAIEYAGGGKYWFVNGDLHREDGPAVEKADLKEWWVNGSLHREDGPAVVRNDGTKAWWVNGAHLTEEQFNKTMNKEPQYIKTDSYGNKFYYKDKELTKFHRTDGPAIERAWGSKLWYLNGKLHRTDGPAIEYSDGSKGWWFIHGKGITEQEFNKRMRPTININGKDFTIEELNALIEAEKEK